MVSNLFLSKKAVTNLPCDNPYIYIPVLVLFSKLFFKVRPFIKKYVLFQNILGEWFTCLILLGLLDTLVILIIFQLPKL